MRIFVFYETHSQTPCFMTSEVLREVFFRILKAVLRNLLHGYDMIKAFLVLRTIQDPYPCPIEFQPLTGKQGST